VRLDLEEGLRAALADADFSRRLIPSIVDVVEAALDCQTCDGSGRQRPEFPSPDCPDCRGSGLGGGR
jgi:hypothetical protein